MESTEAVAACASGEDIRSGGVEAEKNEEKDGSRLLHLETCTRASRF
jgi:hypothetical protein